MKETILIVEDEKDIVKMLEYNLKKEGYKTLAVRNGEDAIDSAKNEHPDLIILDLMLPGIDGLEVCKKIKSDSKTASIPIIMLTTTDDPREIETCYRLGCNCYITKPVEFSKFAETIRRLGLFIVVVQVPAVNGKDGSDVTR